MYNAATISDKSIEGSGRVCLQIDYTGDAGEAMVRVPLFIDQSTAVPAGYVRGVAMDVLARLNQNRTQYQNLNVPFVLDTTTPLPVVTPPVTTPSAEFFAATVPFTPGATPQDVFTITGGTRPVRVIGAGISTMQTTAGVNSWGLLKRSTANTGGASATVAAVPKSGSQAATAVARRYTANPTAGNLVGAAWTGRLASPAPATAGMGLAEKVCDNLNISLADINEVLAFNFNGAALPTGLSVSAWFAWVEN